MSTTHETPGIELAYETANDRFKRSFGSWFWGSVTVATVVHFGIFAFFPELQAESLGVKSDALETVAPPPEVEIPPPPEQIARPATPVVSAAQIDDDITIAPTTFESNPVESLPPPPTLAAGDDMSSFKAFTPDMTEPRLRNKDDVTRALERYYPPLLRDSGVGATVNVLFWIDETGKVVKHQVQGTSGYPQFDEAAVKVAGIMQFAPALNRGQPVRVVVLQKIQFTVQD